MSFNANVTPNMVSQISISSFCYESDPCQHDCKIVLSDGRKKNIRLWGHKIEYLINAIGKEKIFYEKKLSHFNYSDEREDDDPQEIATQFEKKDISEEILTKIFK